MVQICGQICITSTSTSVVLVQRTEDASDEIQFLPMVKYSRRLQSLVRLATRCVNTRTDMAVCIE